MSFDPSEYRNLSDTEKLDLLQLLYHDIKIELKSISLDDFARRKKCIQNKELVVAETQLVYNRIKQRSN
jgi:hypothetical protein